MYRINLVPTGFFLAGAVLILLLWQSWQRAETQRLQLETSVTGEQVVLRLQSCIDTRAALMGALVALGWDNQEQVLADWESRASILFTLHSGILGLNFIDNDWIIRSVYPQSSNLAALGADLHDHPSAPVRTALREAEITGQLHRTDLVELLQSGAGIAMYQRLVSATGEALGYANGVFRLEELMGSCFAEQPLRNRFTFRLLEPEERVFYQQPAAGYTAEPTLAFRQTFAVIGKPWTLDISPSQDYLQLQGSAVPETETVLGLTMLLALSWLLRSFLIKQRALSEKESQYRLLVENQSDMVVEANPAGELLYVSPSYCRTFGKNETELLGRPFLPLIHEDDRELTLQSLELARQPPHHSYNESRAFTRDGWRWLAWSNSAVLDANGVVTAITAVGRDVTDLRHLETRAAHAEKMQALGNMAGGISHDFNNILHVVQANIEFLLLDYPDDANLQTELQSISMTVDRAIALVSRLATLSRQDQVHKELIDLNTFVEEVLALLRRTFPPNIRLHLHPAAEPLLVKADKSQLEQVVLNLCFNARDSFTGAGTIDIELSECAKDFSNKPLEAALEFSSCACLRIADSGAGIAPDILPHIFEPFFTTKPHGSGTGLGLANCYSIMKQHQGDIQVTSEPGKGTQFTLYFPLADTGTNSRQAVDTVVNPTVLPASDSRQVQVNVSSASILIVDDDTEIQRLLSALLNHAGYTTLTAGNGEEALHLLQQTDSGAAVIQLVLMDVLMPTLGGLEATELLQQRFPAVRVLLMSGYVPENDTLGGTPVIRKPFTRDTLLQAVAAVLNGQDPRNNSGSE